MDANEINLLVFVVRVSFIILSVSGFAIVCVTIKKQMNIKRTSFRSVKTRGTSGVSVRVIGILDAIMYCHHVKA